MISDLTLVATALSFESANAPTILPISRVRIRIQKQGIFPTAYVFKMRAQKVFSTGNFNERAGHRVKRECRRRNAQLKTA